MQKKIDLMIMLPSLRGGGAERVMVTLLNQFDRSIFNIELLVIDLSGAVYLNEIPGDIELINLNCSRVRFAIPKIIIEVWRRRPDVILSTLGHFNLALAMFRFALPRGAKTIAREAAIVSYNFPRSFLRFFWANLYKNFYIKHDLVICQSRAMQADLVDNFHVPLNRTAVINNPLDLNRIGVLKNRYIPWEGVMKGNEIRLVAAGRMSHEKGFDILIDALKILNDTSIRLSILGDGPLRNELEERVARNGLEDVVEFVGFQENPYPWFYRADLFVLSSLHEGFPNVVLEALACGTPVVATPAVGGVSEILANVKGCYMADDVSAMSLSNAISLWMSSDRRRIEACVTEPFSVKEISNLYTQEIFEVVGIGD